MKRKTPYLGYFQFLAPLVVTVILRELGVQVLNGGMARMPRATETLAAYGLAWGLVVFLSSPLVQTRQLSLVLVDSRQALRKARRFVSGAGVLLGLIVWGLARTPFGVWVLEVLHGVERELSGVVQEALLWLVPLPLIRGIGWFYSGTLLRVRRTDWVSAAILAGIAASIVTVFAFLPLSMVQQKPIRLPLFVTYAGALVELGIVLWGYRRLVPPELRGESPGEPLTYPRTFHFFWPLALIMAVQGGSRPLVNLFVSRGPDGTEALAVLTVVYALAHVPYGWLNELRNLAPAFKGAPEGLASIRRFALSCGLVSFGVMVALFWTPVRDVLLRTFIGVEPAIAVRCGPPLMIFTFFPLIVMIRAYLHGVALVQERTRALAPSGPARIAAIWLMLMFLPVAWMDGATRGIVALISGFIAETFVVWWGVTRGEKL